MVRNTLVLMFLLNTRFEGWNNLVSLLSMLMKCFEINVETLEIVTSHLSTLGNGNFSITFYPQSATLYMECLYPF